jgi:hypothetical protein
VFAAYLLIIVAVAALALLPLRVALSALVAA